MLIRLITITVLLRAATGQLQQQTCSIPDTLQSFYHAPARQVPNPPVSAELKRQFLLLFHREGNPEHSHFDPHDNVTETSSQPSLIDPAIIAQINDLCGRNSFFYSFSPRHLRAIQLLQQVFMQQRTAQVLFNLARDELSRHEINPRVWYYALLGTLFARQDLSGYYLAWAVDATPDLYVPWSVIRDAIQGSARPLPEAQMRQCQTALGIVTTDFSFPEPQRPSGQQFASSQPQSTRAFPPSQRFTSRPVSTPRRQRQKRREQSLRTQPLLYRKGSETTERFSNRDKRQGRSSRCILFNGTNGATNHIENQLWYFREDVMVNQHHWYWHQYYPQTSIRHGDRRGEIFYFAHHNIIARYNAERISNGLPREEPLDLRLNGNIGTGYNSDLSDRQSGRFWTPRAHNMPLSDISHENDPDFQIGITMDRVSTLHRTIVSHIAQGFLLANRSLQAGQPPVEFVLDIRNQPGLTHLGNTLEAGDSSINTHPNLYHEFGVHNLGHVAIALAMDPNYVCQLPTGAMADASVTMRDPSFYKIHTLVDDLFDQHKGTLPPYQVSGGEWPLQWAGVHLQDLAVVQAIRTNFLHTFWQIRSFPLEEGIDGSIHDGDVNSQVCQQHLNHEPFSFKLVIDVDSCWQSRSGLGTVRIFMAPRYDQAGRRHNMVEERTLMFQLDSFPVQLRLGRNVITRNSFDSSSTKPWSRSLADMLRHPDNGGETEFCGCGWPRHLYMPKGTPQGMEFDLFAIITNYDEDQVPQSPQEQSVPEPCNSPYLLCGIPHKRYPDARPMGYPFDRHLYSVNDGGFARPVNSLEEYVSHSPNMRSSIVIIRHLDTVLG